jgi:hypothetical protein
MCVTSLGWAYDKIRKRRCQYSGQFERKRVKEDWGHIGTMVLGSHRPHGTGVT